MGVHPEVPNSQTGSHSLTSVRMPERVELRVQLWFTLTHLSVTQCTYNSKSVIVYSMVVNLPAFFLIVIFGDPPDNKKKEKLTSLYPNESTPNLQVSENY